MKPVFDDPRLGAIVAALAAFIGLLTVVVSLVTAPPPVDGIQTYSNLAGRAGVVATTAIALSAVLFDLGVVSATRHGGTIILVAASTALVVGVLMFALTFANSIPVQVSPGVTVYYQPYPQVVYLFVWGIFALVVPFGPASPTSSNEADTGWRPRTSTVSL